MTKIKRSEYIIVSRVVCKSLLSSNCFGKGSLYFDNLSKGLSNREFKELNITKDKVQEILDALVKQDICRKKKKEHGWKYYLNVDRYAKIMEIVKETGTKSAIPLLLVL